MRKTFLILCLLGGLLHPLFADVSANLYSMVVPQEFTAIYVDGSFGTDDVVQLNYDFGPTGGFGLNLGLDGQYEWYQQTETTDFAIGANGYFRITDTNLALNLNGYPSYRTYAFDFSGLPGYWKAGGDLMFNTTLPYATTASTFLRLFPYGEIGVGRIYSIYTLKKIEAMMRYLQITPTESMIRAVAEIMYKQSQIQRQYSDDYSQNYLSYHQSIAQALGRPDQLANIILINNSQTFSFDEQRYIGLRNGWQAWARLTPGLKYNKTPFSNTTDFNGMISFNGAYATFLMEDMLHVGADGLIGLNYETDNTTKFFVVISASGTVTYLPADYRWWANGNLKLGLDTSATEKVSFELSGKLNYLINPNFTVHGGLSVSTISDRLSVFAGGRIRLW